ncbi:MAG: translation elongation factor Ts [Myxococcales bacterium]|nr:MAG: translation elongation factor Ts [Myxococcales bacterium]
MVEVTATMVKALRTQTGAGMMDCKHALVEAQGDDKKAAEIIQKKGLAKVAKKAGAIAAEGVVHAYIHPGSRVGVLVEINCQTDFVSRSDEFKALVEDVGLQIASMSPEFVRREDITEEAIASQKKIFQGQIEEEEAASGKKRPEQAVAKILEGKLNKWMSEVCLVDQPSIRDEEGRSIQQLVEALTAKIGEKISIRRFVRFELGEGIEKKQSDLAAEVADTLKSS